MTRVLCVDPGLTTTGFAVLRDGELLYVNQCPTNPTDHLADRVEKVTTALRIPVATYQPDSAVVELLHGGYRAGTRARVLNFVDLRNLALLTGAIVGELKRLGLAVQLVEPSVMRIAGKPVRREVKKQIARAIVAKRYGQKIPEHAADAILLGVPATTQEIVDGWAEVVRNKALDTRP